MDIESALIGMGLCLIIGVVIGECMYRPKYESCAVELARAKRHTEQLREMIESNKQDFINFRNQHKEELERQDNDFKRQIKNAENRVPQRFIPLLPNTYTVLAIDEQGRQVHAEAYQVFVSEGGASIMPCKPNFCSPTNAYGKNVIS